MSQTPLHLSNTHLPIFGEIPGKLVARTAYLGGKIKHTAILNLGTNLNENSLAEAFD